MKRRIIKMNELKYPSKDTIKRLTMELNLKGADEYTQDWEYEVANVNQLSDYIYLYKNGELNLNEKTTLMRIILEAYNEYITLENYEDTYRKSIELFLRKDYDIHKETIAYWSCGNEDLTDCFAISSFMRRLLSI